jgi:hypothetical protein
LGIALGLSITIVSGVLLFLIETLSVAFDHMVKGAGLDVVDRCELAIENHALTSE